MIKLKHNVTIFNCLEYFKELLNKWQNNSVYLSSASKESRATSALLLPGAVPNHGIVHPILAPSSPVHLLTQIFRLISISSSAGLSLWPVDYMQDKILSSSYLNSMIHSKLSVLSNWFSRFEARLLFWLLMALKDCPASFSAAHHALAIRTCGLLHSPDEILVRDLLELIVFNKSFLKSEDLLAQHLDRISVHETLPLASASTRDSINTSLIRSMEKSMDNIQDIKTMYLEKLLNDTKCRHSLSYHNSENSGVQVLTFECETVLSLDWQYFPLLETYNLEQNNKLTNI